MFDMLSMEQKTDSSSLFFSFPGDCSYWSSASEMMLLLLMLVARWKPGNPSGTLYEFCYLDGVYC